MENTTSKGLRLFNLVLERATRESRVETSRTIFYKLTQILTYDDDIEIIALRLSYVAEAYQEQPVKNLGLQINETTIKLMWQHQRPYQ